MSGKTTMSDCLYSPQVSPGNPNITPPTTVAPTVVLATQVTFTYPPVSPTLTVSIDAPNFNNRDTIRISRVSRETRGKTFRTFRNSSWPVVRRLAIAIERIDPTAVANLKTFINSTIGKQIGYMDHESRHWVGVILNPDSAISQEGPGCQYTLSLNFEGVLG
jgi:hypothetical protein